MIFDGARQRRNSKIEKRNEKHQEAVPFRVLADVRVVRAFVWPATSFWLATRQRRERAAGPRELSCGGDLSPCRGRRQYAGGYQSGAAGHDIPDAHRGVERGPTASRGPG